MLRIPQAAVNDIPSAVCGYPVSSFFPNVPKPTASSGSRQTCDSLHLRPSAAESANWRECCRSSPVRWPTRGRCSVGRWEGTPDAFVGGEVAEELHNEIAAAVSHAANEFNEPADEAAGIWVDEPSLIRDIIVELHAALGRA